MKASPTAMTIGEVAAETGVPAKTIRYYEDAGLIAPATRADNGYRVYDERSLEVLRFVKRARDLGFGMAEVGELLALFRDPRRASADVRRVASRHLREVEQKLVELERLRGSLAALVARCHGDGEPDCPILDELVGRPAPRRSPAERPRRK